EIRRTRRGSTGPGILLAGKQQREGSTPVADRHAVSERTGMRGPPDVHAGGGIAPSAGPIEGLMAHRGDHRVQLRLGPLPGPDRDETDESRHEDDEMRQATAAAAPGSGSRDAGTRRP